MLVEGHSTFRLRTSWALGRLEVAIKHQPVEFRKLTFLALKSSVPVVVMSSVHANEWLIGRKGFSMESLAIY